jgi:type IV secretory pathway VirB4 component
MIVNTKLQPRSLLEATRSERRASTRRTQQSFFAFFFAALNREAAADPEPEGFTSEWLAWQRRHWEREGLRTELREAQALTIEENDPAPLAREGLASFLDWARRQDARRAGRRRRSKRWAS